MYITIYQSDIITNVQGLAMTGIEPRTLQVWQLIQHLYDLLSTRVDSAFRPYGVGKMSTSFCWGLTCDGLVSRAGRFNDSHPLNTTETREKRRLQ